MKMIKSCTNLKIPLLLHYFFLNDHEIDYNHDTGKRLGNLIVNIVSSVSARKLKCPSSARLRTFIARAGSSRKIPARTHLYYLRQNSLSFKASKGRVEGGYKDETLCP